MSPTYDPDLLHSRADIDFALDPDTMPGWIVWRASDGSIRATLMHRRWWGKARRWARRTITISGVTA